MGVSALFGFWVLHSEVFKLWNALVMFSNIILILVSCPFSLSFAPFRLIWLFLGPRVWTRAYTEKHFEPQITLWKSGTILQSLFSVSME